MGQKGSNQLFCVVAWPGNELEAFPATKDTAMLSAADKLGPKGYSINSLHVEAGCALEAVQIAEEQKHCWIPPHQVMKAHKQEAITRMGKPYRMEIGPIVNGFTPQIGDEKKYSQGNKNYSSTNDERLLWKETWKGLVEQFMSSSWYPWKREKADILQKEEAGPSEHKISPDVSMDEPSPTS